MAPDFLVHEAVDGVGVVVVEGLKANQEITGWIMKEDETITIKILSDIPIGHKVALKDFAEGDTVIKYNIEPLDRTGNLENLARVVVFGLSLATAKRSGFR